MDSTCSDCVENFELSANVCIKVKENKCEAAAKDGAAGGEERRSKN